MLKLISATPSPYARKVRIALAEKNIPFELITEVPWNSTTKTPQHNPLEKLPVLIVPASGTADTPGTNKEVSVYESHHILTWLEVKLPATSLLPSDPDARLAAQEVEVVCDGICDALVLRFFEIQREHQSKEWIARQMRKVDGGVKWLAEKVDALKDGEQFLVGKTFGLADIAAGSVCGYLDVRFAEYPWRKTYPKLAAYVDRLLERQSFKDTVPSPQKIDDKIV